MRTIYDPVFLEHETGMHPENHKRLAGLGLDAEVVPSGEQYLELVHTPDYIRSVREACVKGVHLDADTVVSPHSFEAAVRAVGATVLASNEGGFAVVRPPGHHAYPGHASGFCVFNNVAIATRRLANQGKRVLVFDFDGHLGDGTSRIFEEDDQVMYWSIHQFPAFPGHGSADEIGTGKGRGFTMNVPLPPGSGDDLFMDGIRQTLPVTKAFKPDVVAVSAGFDAHQHDLLLDLRVTMGSFHAVGRLLAEEFENVFATLEGGYNVETLGACLRAFLDGYHQLPLQTPERKTESAFRLHDEFSLRMDTLHAGLAKYWTV